MIYLVLFLSSSCLEYNWVKCMVEGCGKRVSRGKTGVVKRDLTTNVMKKHLQKVHPMLWHDLEAEEATNKATTAADIQRRQDRDETATGRVKIFNLRTAEEKGAETHTEP